MSETIKDEPIAFFKNNTEFQKCARDWQKKLLLADWLIRFELVPKPMYIGEEKTTRVLGVCKRIHANHEAFIQISHVDPKELNDESEIISKPIEELTLVHELLHCILNPIDYTEEQMCYETAYVELDGHTKVESLAKSLIMTKYNLTLDYFLK